MGFAISPQLPDNISDIIPDIRGLLGAYLITLIQLRLTKQPQYGFFISEVIHEIFPRFDRFTIALAFAISEINDVSK